MNILKIVILAVLVTLLNPRALAVESRMFGSAQLSSTRFTCIFQDKYGYIWVATEYGLNRFDGYRFITYLNKPEDASTLSHNHIVWIDADREGRLWVMTAKGLAQYDYARDCFIRYDLMPGQKDKPRASRIVQDAAGRLYLGTSGYGLYEIKPEETRAEHIGKFPTDKSNDYFQNMFIDNADRFWRIDNTNTIYCYVRNKNRLLYKSKITMGLPMRILQGKGSDVIIVCQKGLHVYSGGVMRQLPLDLGSLTIECAVVKDGGDILLGTLGNGVYRLSEKTGRMEPVELMSRSVDVRTSRIGALFEDRQGNLWLGCNEKGLLFVSTRKTQFRQWSFTVQGIKTGSAVSAVCGDGEEGAWCSIHNGQLYHFDRHGKIVGAADAPTDLKSIYRDRQGQFWLTAGSAVYRFDPNSGRHQLFRDFECDYITSMTDDGRGTLFVSTEGRGMAVVNTLTGALRQYDMYQTEDPRGYLCNNWVQSFLYDSHGLLWAGTAYGLSCYDPRRNRFDTFG